MEVKKREGKDTQVKHSSEKKREDPDMEVKRCLGKKRKGSYTNAKPCSDLPGKKKKKKRERKRRVLFNVIRRDKDNYIHVIDVNRDFLPASADIKYSGRSKSNRIAGHDREPPSMWRPYMYFETTGKPGELPKDMAMVALGSEIYLIGGHWDVSSSLPRQVYVIDTAKEYHHSVDPPVRKKKSCVLNQGKRHPIAWTIRGNIYVMPHTFAGKVTQSNSKRAGKLFERYDPNSNSWTILPSPPVENLNPGCAKGDLDPLLVTSHAVLGSRLLISLGTFVFAFDTARTDGGWTKIAIELEHGPHRGLNILPIYPGHSSPLGDNLVLCYPRVATYDPKNRLPGLLEETLGIVCRKDYYVCRFDENGDDLKASITPFDGSSFGMRWAEFFRPVHGCSCQATLLGEDLILFAKVGRDYDSFSFYNDGESDEEEFLSRWWNRNDIGDTYLSLELFRVSEAPAPPDGERRYQASGTRSALFKVDDEDHASLELFRCFVMEDGIFVN